MTRYTHPPQTPKGGRYEIKKVQSVMVDVGDIENGIASIVDTGCMVRDVYDLKEVNMYWIKIKNSNDASQWELRYTDLEFTDNSYDVVGLIAEILEHSYKEAHISIEYEEDF